MDPSFFYESMRVIATGGDGLAWKTPRELLSGKDSLAGNILYDLSEAIEDLPSRIAEMTDLNNLVLERLVVPEGQRRMGNVYRRPRVVLAAYETSRGSLVVEWQPEGSKNLSGSEGPSDYVDLRYMSMSYGWTMPENRILMVRRFDLLRYRLSESTGWEDKVPEKALMRLTVRTVEHVIRQVGYHAEVSRVLCVPKLVFIQGFGHANVPESIAGCEFVDPQEEARLQKEAEARKDEAVAREVLSRTGMDGPALAALLAECNGKHAAAARKVRKAGGRATADSLRTYFSIAGTAKAAP